MSESVEQAARHDWKAHAEREAAALLAEVQPITSATNYPVLLAMVAAAWLQGCNYGMHDALSQVDATFEEVRAEL